ncbi:MAG: M1 family metallopeptidase [Bacteroidales bacterium]|nr:M1 family metallopeptidase [Bacteroidales bacterium]
MTSFSINLSSQTDLYDKLDYIRDDLDKKKYYYVLECLEKLTTEYPDFPNGYLWKAWTYFYLNDIYACRENIKIAMGRGIGTEGTVLNYLVFPDILAKAVSEGYYEGELLQKNSFRPAVTRKDSLQGALTPERSCFDVTFYDLALTVDPKKKTISGKNRIHFNVVQTSPKIQIDLFENLEVNSITRQGKELPFTRDCNAIFISFPEPLQEGGREILEISYSGAPRVAPDPPWNGGFVWDKTKGNYWVGVACEHLGASCWWPNKDHLSDKPDSMRITVTAPPNHMVVSNGTLIRQEETDDYSKYEWFVSYPINNYLATIYIGNFIQFTDTLTNANGSYPIDYYVLPHNLKKAQKYYSTTRDIVKVFEELYGDYPFPRDGMGMIESPYMGMEHQGAIAIGGDYGKADRRVYEKLDYDYLLVHETAHEWWGNGVTMDDMAEAWISEGFATYSEALLMEKKYDSDQYWKVIIANMGEVLNLWPVVGKRGINDNSFLGGDIYHKGAIILHNLRCTINDDSLFFHLIKEFHTRNLYKAVTSNDFLLLVNELTQKDFSPFFSKFLYDKEPPVLSYKFIREGDKFYLSYKWTRVKPGFEMPFLFVTNNSVQHRLMGTTKGQTVELQDVKSFSIANQHLFPDDILKNSMTYFWTSIDFSTSYAQK